METVVGSTDGSTNNGSAMMMAVGQIDDSFDFEGQISAAAQLFSGMDTAHAYSELLLWSLAINPIFSLRPLHT